MKCYVCQYEGDFVEVSVNVTSAGKWASAGLEINYRDTLNDYRSRVDLYACPRCGAMHSDLLGMVEQKDRIPSGERRTKHVDGDGVERPLGLVLKKHRR